MGALRRADGRYPWLLCIRLPNRSGLVSKDWNGFNVLHHAAARVAGLIWALCRKRVARMLPVSWTAAAKGAIELVWLHGADEMDMADFANSLCRLSAIMAIRAHNVPQILSCLPPPIRKKTAYMSILKAGFRWAPGCIPARGCA